MAETSLYARLVPVGIQKLDRMLDGGVRDRDRVLLYGPSFHGKEVLARTAFLAALKNGRPAIMLLTNRGVDEVQRDLRDADSNYASYEKAGLPWFVDAYSRSIGIEDKAKNVEFVDSAVDLNNISLALNRIHGKIVKDHSEHLMVLDSVSTLVLYGNAQATFRFLQVLVGRARQAGATTLLLLDHGMHSDAEVQMFRHLCDGAIEMRKDGDTTRLQIEGLSIKQDAGWVDYQVQGHSLEITGSLAAGRIR